MKLLIIAPSFYPATYYGGPIYSTYELAKALKKSGIDLKVITTNANGRDRLKVKTGVFHRLENDLPVKYYKSLNSSGISLSMLWNLWGEITKVDLVYLVSIFSAPTPVTILLCKLLKKPLIISPRGQLGKWCLEQGSIFKKLWLHTFIHPYISILHWHLASAEEQQDVLAIYPSAKTFVIPNGVSSELFQLNEKEKDRKIFNKYSAFNCSNKLVVISMGRLHKVKGFDILVEAIGKIERKDLVLLIAGENFRERKNLEQIIDKLGLNEKVFFIGRLEGLEKMEFLRNADVFALPSHHENFGMVIAEALAAGTPVVISKNTPWQEVEKYNCGKWVENSTIKFSEAIIEILNSDPIQMGKNGREYVEENFSWEKIAYNFQKQVEKSISTSANDK